MSSNGNGRGMVWLSRGPGAPQAPATGEEFVPPVNTRTSLWSARWPAVALQSCIDTIEAAPADEQPEVKFNLPCQTCPERTGCLNAKRKELGPLLYDREIQTQPRSAESSLFPRALFNPMLRPREALVPHWRPPFSLEHDYAVCQAWDLAWSERTGGDYLVCMTAYVHRPTGVRHLVDVQRWQRRTFDEQCQLIEEKWRQYNADLVVIEGDAAQTIWSQHMSATTPVPTMSHRAANNKRDLMSGVPGLLIAFENRKWEIPYQPGSLHHEEVVNMLDEFEAFGWVDGKLEGVGEHDDTVMCFWHLSWGIERLLNWDSGGREYYRGNVSGAH